MAWKDNEAAAWNKALREGGLTLHSDANELNACCCVCFPSIAFPCVALFLGFLCSSELS